MVLNIVLRECATLASMGVSTIANFRLVVKSIKTLTTELLDKMAKPNLAGASSVDKEVLNPRVVSHGQGKVATKRKKSASERRA